MQSIGRSGRDFQVIQASPFLSRQALGESPWRILIRQPQGSRISLLYRQRGPARLWLYVCLVGLPVAASTATGGTYARHEPEDTVLYRIVAEHLETFLAEAREKHERGLPDYVEEELREYLKCGILAHGFLRARCRSCGKNMLVALSCKKRGVCPSCNARRMCGTAAHLTLHVVPDIPARQWVLSVPFELPFTPRPRPACAHGGGTDLRTRSSAGSARAQAWQASAVCKAEQSAFRNASEEA